MKRLYSLRFLCNELKLAVIIRNTIIFGTIKMKADMMLTENDQMKCLYSLRFLCNELKLAIIIRNTILEQSK